MLSFWVAIFNVPECISPHSFGYFTRMANLPPDGYYFHPINMVCDPMFYDDVSSPRQPTTSSLNLSIEFSNILGYMRPLVYETPVGSAEDLVVRIVAVVEKNNDTRNLREGASVVHSPVSPVQRHG
ncbi:hypothetical protein TNCV_1350901 [Trichonephila clavipes]|nr:hypothetical protein TNCV_1350901 [Trichonephila clavipes]